MLAGISTAVKSMKSDARVYGVEPVTACGVFKSLQVWKSHKGFIFKNVIETSWLLCCFFFIFAMPLYYLFILARNAYFYIFTCLSDPQWGCQFRVHIFIPAGFEPWTLPEFSTLPLLAAMDTLVSQKK